MFFQWFFDCFRASPQWLLSFLKDFYGFFLSISISDTFERLVLVFEFVENDLKKCPADYWQDKRLLQADQASRGDTTTP